MKHQSYIEKLQKQQPLKLEDITNWLQETNNTFYNAIEATECHKWKKWQRNNAFFVLPCIHNGKKCDDECVFIAFYRKLDVFTKTIHTEGFYNQMLEQYQKIKHNQNAVFEWIIDIEQFGNELTLIDNEIDYNFVENTNYSTVELDKTELQNLWEFKEIFGEHYFSLEFHNYINP